MSPDREQNSIPAVILAVGLVAVALLASGGSKSNRKGDFDHRDNDLRQEPRNPSHVQAVPKRGTHGGDAPHTEPGSGRRTKYWTRKLQIAEQCVVIVGVFGLFWQSCEMRKTNAIATAAFTADRQPVLYVIPLKTVRYSGDGTTGTILWNFRRVNYGPFPAVGVRDRYRVIYGADIGATENGITEFFNSLPDRLVPESVSTGGAVEPPINDDAQNIVIANSTPVSAADFESAMKTNLRIALVGRIEYSDMSGNLYRTDFCFWRTMFGDLWACQSPPTRNNISELKDGQ